MPHAAIHPGSNQPVGIEAGNIPFPAMLREKPACIPADEHGQAEQKYSGNQGD